MITRWFIMTAVASAFACAPASQDKGNKSSTPDKAAASKPAASAKTGAQPASAPASAPAKEHGHAHGGDGHAEEHKENGSKDHHNHDHE